MLTFNQSALIRSLSAVLVFLVFVLLSSTFCLLRVSKIRLIIFQNHLEQNHEDTPALPDGTLIPLSGFIILQNRICSEV